MNWIRTELKAEARAALSKGYWRTVLVALILMMVAGSGVSVGNAPPLTVGCARYTELAIKRPADFNLGRGFSPNYWNVVKSMFIRTLFTALWALLYAVVYLILTGIIVGVMIASDASGGVIVFLMFLLFLIGLAGGFLLALTPRCIPHFEGNGER